MSILGIAQLSAMVAIYPSARLKHSNRSIFCGACCIALLGYAFLAVCIPVPKNSFLLLLIPGIFIATGNGIAYVQTTLFVAGAVDHGQAATGRRDSSVVSSLQTFIVKISSAFAVLIAGIGIDATGLVRNAAEQSRATLLGMRLLFSAPCLLLMSFALLLFLNRPSLGRDVLPDE